MFKLNMFLNTRTKKKVVQRSLYNGKHVHARVFIDASGDALYAS